jgi:hypothetical protein
MAKPLGQKSRIIREAIHNHPDKGNTAIAEMLNDSADRLDDKLTFTATDVSQQRTALKNLGKSASGAAPAPATQEAATEATPARGDATPASQPEAPAPKRRGRKAGRKPKARTAANDAPAPAPRPAGHSRPVEVLGKVFDLAKECGGFVELKLLVDRLASLEKR